MATNTELEMRWVDAWNDLYDLIRGRHDVRCQLPDPDWAVVDVEKCKGWLQNSAYEGFHLKVEAGYVLGRPGIIVTRWKDSGAP